MVRWCDGAMRRRSSARPRSVSPKLPTRFFVLGICNVPRTEPPRGWYPLSNRGAARATELANAMQAGRLSRRRSQDPPCLYSCRGHVTRTAMRAIVITSGTPYIHPLARTVVTAVDFEIARAPPGRRTVRRAASHLSDGGTYRFVGLPREPRARHRCVCFKAT